MRACVTQHEFGLCEYVAKAAPEVLPGDVRCVKLFPYLSHTCVRPLSF